MPVRQPDRVPENVTIPRDFRAAAELINSDGATIRGCMYKLADETWLRLLLANPIGGEPSPNALLLGDTPPSSVIVLAWRGVPILTYSPTGWIILNHDNLPNIRAISDIIQRCLGTTSGCELEITNANWPTWQPGQWTVASYNCAAATGERSTPDPLCRTPFTNMMGVFPATGAVGNPHIQVTLPAG